MKHLITPTAPYSFVADQIAIGGIVAYGEPLPFGLCINVAREFTEKSTGPSAPIKGVPLLQFSLDDTDDKAVIRAQSNEVRLAVQALARVRETGKAVLVTCAQGRNRSALVAAEYLIQCGKDPDYVVETIQHRRANSLTNKAFVAWLKRRRNR